MINDLKYRIFNRQDFNNKKKNSAVILCGGKGTRLGQLGKKIPKPLVKIHGYPIIWYIINILKRNSFNHFAFRDFDKCLARVVFPEPGNPNINIL